MKKCILCLVVDDSKNFGDNSNKFFELNTAEGKLLMPLVEIEAANLISLKHHTVLTVKTLFGSIIKEEWEARKKEERDAVH